jgi:DNA-binding LacI/PurR family transcriptional regulator
MVSSVSIKDIAQVAGVSHSTVSRALRRSPLVNSETAVRIRRLAQLMGYSPSAVARGLVTRRTATVGVVVTTIADPFVAEVVRGIERVSLEQGYSVLLCNSNAEPEREMAAVHMLREKRVDGVVVTASRIGALYLPLLEEIRVPIVLINSQREGQYVFSVATDNVGSAYQATRYLHSLGHIRIGHVTGCGETQSSVDRQAGYRQALIDVGIVPAPAWIVEGNGRIEGGERAVQALLRVDPPLTAIFCYNDLTAIGVLKALKQAGHRVPDDMSLVGFDDIALASYVEPALTTVEQRKQQMGQTAMEMLLRLLSGDKSVTNVVLPGRLVERASCKSVDMPAC